MSKSVKKPSRFLSFLLALMMVLSTVLPYVSLAQTVSKWTTTTAAKVNCYAALEGKWTLVKSITTNKQANVGKTRYYVTASELEEVYTNYGFVASEYKGDRIFPHTDTYDPNNIWADATAVYDDETKDYLIPVSHRTESNLYYLPNNIEGNSSYFTSSCKIDNQNVLNANSFYRVKVNDYTSLIPDGTTPELPDEQLMLTGTSKDIVLPLVDNVNYVCENMNESTVLSFKQTTDIQNKTVTISVSNINCPVNIYTKSATSIGENDALVMCYVAINGQWTLVTNKIVSNQTKFSDKIRYYITSAELEEIYGKYGFSEANYNGEHIFPHTDSYDRDNIWADQEPTYDDTSGTYLIPLSHRKEIYLYYLPHNTESYGSYFTTSCKITDKNVLSNNSFYTVKVVDSHNLIPKEDLPEDDLLLSGSNKNITLPYIEDMSYKIINNTTKKPIDYSQMVDEASGTVTISITDINCPVLISTSTGVPTVTYSATIKDQLVKIGEFGTERQVLTTDGTVNQQLIYIDDLDSAAVKTYKFLDIDSETVTVGINGYNGNNRHFIYSFLGWKIGDTDTIVQPGDDININTLKGYADSDNNIALTAVWNILDSNDRANTINFYVNLDCEIMDNESNGFQSQHANLFTSSVYSTRIFGTDNVPLSDKEYTDPNDKKYVQLIAPPTSADTAYEADSKIRAGITTPIEPGITIEDFPSNESILAQLRAQNKTFTLDGKEINKDDITTDNFTIRWYVLKYEKNDAWHIDGVLVAKTGRLVIKKTFAGDSEAIEKVKRKFNISVTHTDDQTKKDITDFTLSLNSKAEESDKSKTGYTSYDAETDTYTWSLPVRQGRTYNVKENNYYIDQDRWNNSIHYKIINSENETDGWHTYTNNGVEVTAVAYPNDLPDAAIQTVEFRNMYVQSGVLTVQKIDSITQNGLKNIKFKLSKVDGTPIVLYKKQDSNDYSTDTAAQSEGYNEKIENNIVETDANGYFTVKLAIHGTGTLSEQYYLEEEIPTGYEGPTKIKITVTDMGKVELAQEVVESTTVDNSDWLAGEGTNILTIKNKSKLLTSVKVQKDWGDTEVSKQENVKAELWRNGAKLTDKVYNQILSADTDWTYEWSNLPLFVDGTPANYVVRETAIGNTAYDANADSDGYEDYMVTYDMPLYKEGADGTYSGEQTWLDADGTRHFADHALLVVHNRTVNSEIAFAKVDDLGRPLQNAEFTLYTDEACTNAVDTAVSDTSGHVKFSKQISGTYYMKETKVPDNYLPNDTVYKIVVKAGKFTITENGETTPISEIVNYYALRNLDFSFIKTDIDGKPLYGAKFGLYKLVCTDDTHDHSEDLIKVNSDGTPKEEFADCWELVSIQTSAKKTGLVKFSNLRGGETYRLTEITPPHGYMSPKGQWEIVYDQTAQKYVITAKGKVSQTPAFENVENEAAPYRLANYKLNDMPSAGAIGILMFVAVGMILIIAGFAIIVILKKRLNN